MTTALDGIAALGRANTGKTDRDTLVMLKQTIKAMETRNSKWPTDELAKVVYEMDDMSKRYFYDILKDMETEIEVMIERGEI